MSDPNTIVLFPIEVPDSDYCWDGHHVCQYLETTGGHPTCELFVGHPSYNKEGIVPKPAECSRLSRLGEGLGWGT
jgi:hypothetical protein